MDTPERNYYKENANTGTNIAVALKYCKILFIITERNTFY